MRYFILPLLTLTFFLSAAESFVAKKPLSSSSSASSKKPTPTLIAPSGNAKSVIVVDAKKRSEDYQKAYELLRKDKPPSRIFFKLSSGATISNIADLVVIENGTLILFKSTSSQGFKYEVVPVEEIATLGHL